MIRRFNYTDRLKIPHQNVRLAWVDSGNGPLQFKGEFDLELDRLLDPSGAVFVEAYIGPAVMRFSFGTVAHREHPEDTRLTDFPPGLKPLFRIRVVDRSIDKRVLAWADAVSPLAPDEVEGGRRSILPVETVDLGPRVWNLRIDSNKFFLQLNSAIREPHDITVMARDADFIALVYPAVIRQILTHLLLGPETESVEEDHDWLTFAAALTGRRAPTNDGDAGEELFMSDVEDWITEAVEAFCLQQHAAETFVTFKREAEASNV
ncbi:MAG TPA: hypothetical protein VGG34_10490 [Opitutaceae bacterium]|jgi:hypothetical protein